MIFLREVTNADMSLVFAWHQNRQVNQGFYTLGKRDETLGWEEHSKWWNETTKSWKKFMVVLVEKEISRPIGIIRISGIEDFSPQISITIGEVSLWGKGYGKQALRLALEWLGKIGKNHTHTTVNTNNERGLRLYKSLGFEVYGKAREGEVWMQKNLY